MGFGEFDQWGNVNVSRLGGLTVGPGGFIDIAQNAEKVIFCGSFQAKGTKLAFGDGQLIVENQGSIQKLVNQVDQITFSGQQASAQGQEVLYVTERAVFRLSEDGLELIEIAPGVDLEHDVLDQMEFTPIIAKTMNRMPQACFQMEFDLDK